MVLFITISYSCVEKGKVRVWCLIYVAMFVLVISFSSVSCCCSSFLVRWNWHSHPYAASIHGYCCCWWLLHWNKSSIGWWHHHDKWVNCCNFTYSMLTNESSWDSGKFNFSISLQTYTHLQNVDTNCFYIYM